MIISQGIHDILFGKKDWDVLQGSCLETLKQLPDDSVHCVVTSPPYWGLRNYGTNPQLWGGDSSCQHEWQEVAPRRIRTKDDVKNPDSVQNQNIGANCELPPTAVCLKCKGWLGELGLEPTPELFVEHLRMIFSEVRRVLHPTGICWINIGDTYAAGSKHSKNPHPFIKDKELCGIPWRMAFALQEDGWYLRSDCIWSKANCMPESVIDRPTRSHEYMFMFTKSAHYFYDREGYREPLSEHAKGNVPDEAAGGNKRTIWHLRTSSFEGEHYAGFPEDLPKIAILLSTSEKGCCSKCRSPYQRLIEKVYPVLGKPNTASQGKEWASTMAGGGSGLKKHSGYKKADGTSTIPIIKTVGWEPTCKCSVTEPDIPIVPCLVIDPFNGSGTTCQVAVKAGRNYIGHELNPEYVQMTTERMNGGKETLWS